MKKILYSSGVLALFASVVFISGCNKVVVVDGHVASVVEVFTAPGTTWTATTLYTYDQYGRQILQTQTQSGSFDTLATTYIGYTIVTDTNRSNGIVSTIAYFLDAGLLTHDNSGIGYAYDNNGYLISTRIPPSETINNTILNGNTITSVDNQPGSDTSTTNNTFLPNTEYSNYGINFNGKPNKNLINSSTYIYSQSGIVTTTTYTHTYTFDGHGRVSQETVTGTDATRAVYTYIYTTS